MVLRTAGGAPPMEPVGRVLVVEVGHPILRLPHVTVIPGESKPASLNGLTYLHK